MRQTKPNLRLCYSIRCRNCRYSRTYGYAELTAMTKASSHALRLSHIVDIHQSNLETLTNRLYDTVGAHGLQMWQDSNKWNDEVPF